MKTIQTFWSNKDYMNNYTYGWLDRRFHWMSWALSSCLIHERYNNLTLFSDDIGAEILINKLDLPYNDMVLSQNSIENDPTYWVMRKLDSLAYINEPFIHIDGDLYLWKDLSDTFNSSQIICQNFQLGFSCYRDIIDIFKKYNIPIPLNLDQAENLKAINMGIFGGKDYKTFKSFQTWLKKYVDEIKGPLISLFKGKDVTSLNTFLEECLFYHYSTQLKKNITPLIEEKFDVKYLGIGEMTNPKYPLTHLIGSYKKNLFYSLQIENILSVRFPDKFEKVNNFLRKLNNVSTIISLNSLSDKKVKYKIACRKKGEKIYRNRIYNSSIVDRFSDTLSLNNEITFNSFNDVASFTIYDLNGQLKFEKGISKLGLIIVKILNENNLDIKSLMRKIFEIQNPLTFTVSRHLVNLINYQISILTLCGIINYSEKSLDKCKSVLTAQNTQLV